ncbi:MAG: DMT family transporter [Candidatus Zhuqueibacterota bacterium]
MAHTSPQKSALIIIAFGLVSISFASIFIKMSDAPSLVIAAYRLVLASLFYVAFTRIKAGPIGAGISRSSFRMMFISAIFLTIHFSAWITSLKYTSVASSVVLVQSAPIFVALGSLVFLRERPSLLMISGIAIALIGAIGISIHDFAMNQGTLFGNVLALGGALGAAGYLLAGRKIRAVVDTFPYVTIVYSLTAVFLLLLTLASGAALTGYSGRNYLLFFAIAFFPQVIGHTSFNWALKYFSATAVSILLLGEPIGASILAVIFLGESLSLMKVIGGLVILTGVSIAIIAEGRVHKQQV